MNKIYLSNHIKLEILNICGLPTARSYNLEGNTHLYTLGYEDSTHCKQLEDKLKVIAADYRPDQHIKIGNISKEFTVSDCIQLVLK